MLFKNAFDHHPELRFVIDKMRFYSSLGHYFMLNSSMIADEAMLQESLNRLGEIVGLLKYGRHRTDFSKISRNIHLLNNITPTIDSLKKGSSLDDIQLFEVKKSAIYIKNIAEAAQNMQLPWLTFHDMSRVISILDPENTKIPHFYIYSTYDEDLKKVRNKIEKCDNATEKETLRFEEQRIEDRIRRKLSDQLRPFADALSDNIIAVANLDIMIAKAHFAIETNSCKPEISNTHRYANLVNPAVADALEKNGRKFQPVSISFANETVLITGANMGGKSVLLQTLALAQLLFQFGFYIPAESAEIAVVDEILCSFGDRQSSASGLSSFAVEVLTIDNIIKTAKDGKRVLALVDELARTTNPDEGRLLVNGFIRMCKKLSLTAVVTTHYSGISANCRKLRVKGLQIPENASKLPTARISDYMDYSLVDSHGDEVPKEAFTIARLLHVDEDFINECVN